tara:strand:+ start:2514 stop:2696 length:183 start_codon:yes stop_codon:yes gene_type:complete
MVKIKFECIIELDDNDDIQCQHLPEEIQSYLDSAYYYDDNDGIKPAKVIKWRTTQNDDLS